jgi:hypothetical protein
MDVPFTDLSMASWELASWELAPSRLLDPGMRRDDGGIFRRDDGGAVSRTVWSRRLAF